MVASAIGNWAGPWLVEVERRGPMEAGGDDHTATPEIIYSCPDFCVKTQKVVW